jgi:hypothetical protein
MPCCALVCGKMVGMTMPGVDVSKLILDVKGGISVGTSKDSHAGARGDTKGA